MPLLLNIDTATEFASVCISMDGSSLAIAHNENQKAHASFVHMAIAQLLEKTGCKLKDFEGFAVTSGPGSYTGLRVGMATAKGFCYALSKPLITINTLEVMTKAAMVANVNFGDDLLFCPMIDARRMEVFTAIYNSDMESILSPRAIIIDEETFSDYMVNNKILFFGSGRNKFMQVQSAGNGLFSGVQHNASNLASLADIAFHKKNFSDLSYSEPTYFKDFHSITKSY